MPTELMPKLVVKSLWYQGNQNITQLAETLLVSTRAIRFRLDQLGLTEPTGRCQWPSKPSSFAVATAGGQM